MFWCLYIILNLSLPGFDRQSHDLLPNTFNIHHQPQPVFLDCVGAQGHLYIDYTHR